MRQIQIGNIKETVVERADYPPERIKAILGNETVAVLGYGVQGRGQSLNMKDNGVNVIIGLRGKGKGWDLAQQDGWVAGKTLLSLEEAVQRGTIIQYLLSDAGQKEQWPTLKPLLTEGKALYFSHGFSIVYSDQTGVIPPKDIDVILVAPKDREPRCVASSSKAKASTPATRSIKMRPAGPSTAAWPAASPSAPVICSKRPFRKKSSAT
jgi:ketol-acid reductoisomerase